MDNFLNYINQPASPLFIMVVMGLTGFTVIAFSFIYDWYETKRTKNNYCMKEELSEQMKKMVNNIVSQVGLIMVFSFILLGLIIL